MKKLIILMLFVTLLSGCSSSGTSAYDSIDLDNDGIALWDTSILETAVLKEANDSVKMSILEIDQETIKVKLLNQSCWDCGYAQYFDLNVCVDDVWYAVPELEGVEPQPAIGYILEGYTTQEKTYQVKERYGVLPSGKYRLVVEGLTAEFMVE